MREAEAQYVLTGKTNDKGLLKKLGMDFHEKLAAGYIHDTYEPAYRHEFKVKTIDFLRTKCSRMPRGFNKEFDELINNRARGIWYFNEMSIPNKNSENPVLSRYMTSRMTAKFLKYRIPQIRVSVGDTGCIKDPNGTVHLGVTEDMLAYRKIIGFPMYEEKCVSPARYKVRLCSSIITSFNQSMTEHSKVIGVHSYIVDTDTFAVHADTVLYRRANDGTFYRWGKANPYAF